MDKLIAHISQYLTLSETEWSFVRENLSTVHYKKHELIFEAGRISQTIYYVAKGMVRLFYRMDGDEKTAFFYPEGKFICAGESFTFQVPARENYQAIEDCELIHLHKDAIDLLLKNIPQLDVIGRIATEDELITCQKIIASFVCLSPEKRYKELLENNRELFARVPQQYIASYLGVSAETLSRIKRRVMMRDQ